MLIIPIFLLFSNYAIAQSSSIKIKLRVTTVALDLNRILVSDSDLVYWPADWRWSWRGSITAGNYATTIPTGYYGFDDLDWRDVPTYGNVNRDIVNWTIELPSGNPAQKFDLCDDIIFSIALEGWEEDDGGDGTYDNDDDNDDDEYAKGSHTFSLTDQLAGETLTTSKNIEGYVFNFEYSYEIINPISRLDLTNAEGEVPVGNVYCEGEDVIITAASTGFSGGYHRWEKKRKGSTENWTHIDNFTGNVINQSVTEVSQHDYRASIIARDGCLGGGEARQSSFGIIYSAPAFPGELPVTIQPSCANENNGRITYTGISSPLPGAEIRLVLEGAVSGWMDARNSFTFDNLLAGNYVVQITVRPIGAITSNCTTDSRIITIWPNVAPIIDISEIKHPGCDETTGSIRVRKDGGPEVTAYSIRATDGAGVLELSNPGEGEVDLEGLLPGSYLLFTEDINGCTTDGIPFNIDLPPASANGTVDKVPILPVSPNFDIECAGGEISVRVTAPDGEGLYRVTSSGDPVSVSLSPESSYLYSLGAGIYQFTFTRQNSSCTYTEEITITENPDTIELSSGNNLPPAACRPNAGSFKAIVTNGTPPFTFELEGGASSRAIMASSFEFTGLATGDYGVTVTDIYGCTSETTTSIAATPDGLELTEESVVAPICFDEALGSAIEISATGGVTPYQYAWSDPGFTATTSQANVLAGNYTVTLTDADDCETSLQVTVPDGRPVTYARVPTDTTLCSGNIYVLDLAAYPGSIITGPGGFESRDPVSLLEVPGAYEVTYVDELGCDTIFTSTVIHTDEAFTARMVLPTDAVISMPVAILEASFPQPGSIEWVVDETRVTKIGEEDNVHFFTFSEPGEYDIGMFANYGGCEDLVVKRITMHADSTTIPGPTLAGRVIERVNIAPNPNNGVFSVETILTTPVRLTQTLYNSDGMQLNRRRSENQDVVTEQYNERLNPGTYYLQVQAGNERRILSIIVL